MKITDEIIIREIAGECILVPTGEKAESFHGIISLSESGKYLVELLKKDVTEDELTDALLSEYETDRETASRDVREFLKKLKNIGIVSE